MRAIGTLHALINRLERVEALDRLAGPLAGVVGRVVRPRPVRNLLSGTYLGHPLHPMLTDLPIGAWTMATLLDAVGGPDAEPAADRLVAVGALAAVPTAASGLNDWSDTTGPETRLGLLHAAVNLATLGLYLGSLAARLRGSRRWGIRLGRLGLGTMLVASYLGGHLTLVRGVNVNRTAWEQGPEEWTPVLDDEQLAEGQHRKVKADGAVLLLHRYRGAVHALANTCSHMGGPLDEGTFDDGCVICPWHGSTFRLADGSVVRGPASSPQPRYETRVRDGRIEVRAAG
ncbi:MAG TPA: Rieske 2Fe-2S domain-containing protein [Candidatus Dormibacteraeota bacterium]|nr:Rieske 2Fe-2S domain-containing protein [Candidatus Dormibacteraeota bacterium]